VSSEPIGRTVSGLDTRSASVRSHETGFGNLVADALREGLKADVAIVNGGAIRGNRMYPAGTVLTPREIRTELPFSNKAVLIELRGSDLKAALENGFSTMGNPSGRFPQVSGLRLEVNADAPAGSRITAIEVNGEPVNGRPPVPGRRRSTSWRAAATTTWPSPAAARFRATPTACSSRLPSSTTCAGAAPVAQNEPIRILIR
jgi:2',3'-cyclic-nucleotide 2'-phosphodiesterase (5'-nucleotidase family)